MSHGGRGGVKAQVAARSTYARFEARIGQVEARIGELETNIEQRYASLMRWSFVFWMGAVAAMIGAVAALDRFLR